MSTFFRRLSKATPIAFSHAFRTQSQSSSSHFRFPVGAIAAISGGISYFYYFSEPNLVNILHIIRSDTCYLVDEADSLMSNMR
ncbi:putative cytochrome-b5 reductase [Helianthus annuus]|nr:putative cytochrome-b5 reductase [Helianthus annuus]